MITRQPSAPYVKTGADAGATETHPKDETVAVANMAAVLRQKFLEFVRSETVRQRAAQDPRATFSITAICNPQNMARLELCVQEELARLAPGLKYHVLQPYFDDPAYIDCLVESAKPWLSKPFDKILFSYHGVPERHLRKGDASKAHCTKVSVSSLGSNTRSSMCKRKA